MNTMTSFMTSLVLGFALTLTGCASSGNMHGESLQGAVHGNSVDFHVAAIEGHEAKIARLEVKIQKLEKRITKFNRRPFRDPKGFLRGGWKLLKGTWQQEVNELRDRIAWHANELARLQASVKEHSPASEEEVRIVTKYAPDNEWPTEEQPLTVKEIDVNPVDYMDFDEPDNEWATEEQPA